MTLTGVRTGDEVVVTDVNQTGVRRLHVQAIGRKYATIDDKKFSLDSGYVSDNHGHERAYTLSAWEHRQAVEQVVLSIQRLSNLPRTFQNISVEQLRLATAMLARVADGLTGTRLI